MPTDRSVWTLACELARSGQYANVVMVERELQRRGLVDSLLATDQYRRNLLTRTCHAMRGTDLDTRLMQSLGLGAAVGSATQANP